MSETVLVKNVADEAQVAKATQKEARGRELELNDIARLLSSREGRRFMWRLLAECGVNRISFAGENIHRTNFNEGMRNVGNVFLADIMEADAEAYILMIRENQKEK